MGRPGRARRLNLLDHARSPTGWINDDDSPNGSNFAFPPITSNEGYNREEDRQVKSYPSGLDQRTRVGNCTGWSLVTKVAFGQLSDPVGRNVSEA
jgi:hypothetical protein